MLACAALSFAGLAGALAVQGLGGWQPCALCVLQRIVLLAILLTACLGLVAPKTRLVAATLAASLGLLGAGVAAWQCWVVAHPVTVCGADPLGLLINASILGKLMPWMFSSYGNCSIVPSVLGLPMPAWSGSLFALQCALASLAAWRFVRRPRLLFVTPY